MKKFLMGLVASAVLFAAPANAAIQLRLDADHGTLSFGQLLANGNDFLTEIGNLGFNDFVYDADIRFTENGHVSFYALGAESGYDNDFVAGNADQVGFSENSNFNQFNPLPAAFGSIYVTAGSSARNSQHDFEFSNNQAMEFVAHMENNGEGMGIFFDNADLNQAGTRVNTDQILLAFADNGGQGDGDYDDLIILARFTSSVPEPATWLMMIMGFGLVGVASRRRRTMVLS